MLALYHNEGNGLFVDEAPRSEVGRRSLLTLGFATLFFDYDNDGWLDIFVANGHIENEIERIQKRVKYAESPHLFHNQGKGKFVEATQSVGPILAHRAWDGGCLRRHRQRWRPRPADDHQRRPGGAVPQRRRERQSQPAHQVGGHDARTATASERLRS